MSTPVIDEKVNEGSIHEKDAQSGSSDEIYIDPVAEKKVPIILQKMRLNSS